MYSKQKSYETHEKGRLAAETRIILLKFINQTYSLVIRMWLNTALFLTVVHFYLILIQFAAMVFRDF